MKKIVLKLSIVLGLAFLFTGCGDKSEEYFKAHPKEAVETHKECMKKYQEMQKDFSFTKINEEFSKDITCLNAKKVGGEILDRSYRQKSLIAELIRDPNMYGEILGLTKPDQISILKIPCIKIIPTYKEIKPNLNNNLHKYKYSELKMKKINSDNKICQIFYDYVESEQKTMIGKTKAIKIKDYKFK